MEGEAPVAVFHDFRPEDLPVTIELFRVDNDEKVWEATIDGPGVLDIPPVARQQGCPVWVRTTMGDGTVYEERPEGET